jgi:hypothetical protein
MPLHGGHSSSTHRVVSNTVRGISLAAHTCCRELVGEQQTLRHCGDAPAQAAVFPHTLNHVA